MHEIRRIDKYWCFLFNIRTGDDPSISDKKVNYRLGSQIGDTITYHYNFFIRINMMLYYLSFAPVFG